MRTGETGPDIICMINRSLKNACDLHASFQYPEKKKGLMIILLNK